MAGAYLAVHHHEANDPASSRAQSNALSWLGLALILLGMVVIRPQWGFPGLWALLPVLGTVFLLQAGPHAVVNRSLLSWRPAVWIGLISYPLYLWHWALWSMLLKVKGPAEAGWPLATQKVGVAMISIALSWLVYQYLEQPIRKSRRLRTSLALLACMGAVAGISGTIHWYQGLPNRAATLVPLTAAQEYLASDVMAENREQCHDRYKRAAWPEDWYCELGDTEAGSWIGVMGDSHAMALTDVLDAYGKEHQVRIVYSSMASCAALLGVTTVMDRPEDCDLIAPSMLQLATRKAPQAVVLLERWKSRISMTRYQGQRAVGGVTALEHGLEHTVQAFSALQVPVVLFRDVPNQQGDVPTAVLRGLSATTLRDRTATEQALNASAITEQENREDQARANGILGAVQQRHPDAVIIGDLSAPLCRQGLCPWADNGVFLYHDGNHLTIAGAERTKDTIARTLANLPRR